VRAWTKASPFFPLSHIGVLVRTPLLSLAEQVSVSLFFQVPLSPVFFKPAMKQKSKLSFVSPFPRLFRRGIEERPPLWSSSVPQMALFSFESSSFTSFARGQNNRAPLPPLPISLVFFACHLRAQLSSVALLGLSPPFPPVFSFFFFIFNRRLGTSIFHVLPLSRGLISPMSLVRFFVPQFFLFGPII